MTGDTGTYFVGARWMTGESAGRTKRNPFQEKYWRRSSYLPDEAFFLYNCKEISSSASPGRGTATKTLIDRKKSKKPVEKTVL